MLHTKSRNVTKIKEIPSVEKYVLGLKPSNISERGKEVEHITRNVPSSDKDTKSTASKASTKKSSGEKNTIQSILHPKVVKHLPINQTSRKYFSWEKNCYRIIYFTKKMHQYLPMLLKRILKEENYVIVIDKTIFSNKSDPIHQCFHLQLRYQDIKREN